MAQVTRVRSRRRPGVRQRDASRQSGSTGTSTTSTGKSIPAATLWHHQPTAGSNSRRLQNPASDWRSEPLRDLFRQAPRKYCVTPTGL